MTETHTAPDEFDPTLAERLAPMTIAEIDAGPVWTWREAAKAATDEYADNLATDVKTGRARVIADPIEIR